jgi:hypothetical protein
MTTLPTLRASTPAILASGGRVRENIVSILAECNAMLGTPEATDPANAAQVATFRARLAVMESAVAEEVSADWFVLTAKNVARDADSVIGDLMGDDHDAAPIMGAFKAETRAIASYRRFTV